MHGLHDDCSPDNPINATPTSELNIHYYAHLSTVRPKRVVLKNDRLLEHNHLSSIKSRR